MEAYRVHTSCRSAARLWSAIACCSVLSSPLALADIEWNIQFNDDGSGFGFDDPTLGATRKATLFAVTDYINSIVDANGTVDILVFQSLNNSSSNVAASASTLYYSELPGFERGTLYEHAVSGLDPDQSLVDGLMEYNFGVPWNSGLGASGALDSDLFSFSLHELSHAMGIASLLSESGESRLTLSNPGKFTVYDSFLRVGSTGEPLFNSEAEFIESTSVLTSNNLVFDGPNARARNDGNAVPVYALSEFVVGTSISHVVIPNSVMFPAFAEGTQHRAYDAASLGILEDIGWTLKPGVFWNRGTGGQIGDAGNWSDPVAPGSDDRVVFNVFSTYTVNLSQDVTHQAADYVYGTVTVNANGHTYSLLGDDDSVSITVDNRGSDAGPAELVLMNGMFTGTNATVAEKPDSIGVATVSGSGTQLVLSDSLRIGVPETPGGVAGTGKVNIDSGASLSVAETVAIGPSGKLIVEGGAIVNMHKVLLQGGTYESAQTVNLGPGQELEGTGLVDASVLGQATSKIAATGDLTLGDFQSSEGVVLLGELSVGSHVVTLSDSDGARLGSRTTIEGGKIVAANGISIGEGEELLGSGEVDGALNLGNGGQVAMFGKVKGPISVDTNNSVPGAVSSITATGDLELGDANTPNGFRNFGELNIGSHTVTLYDMNVARAGQTTMNGGTIVAGNGFYLDVGDSIVGQGLVNAKIEAESGSIIQAQGPLTLGDASTVLGFVNLGDLDVGANTVELQDLNVARVGNVSIDGGTLVAQNGFLLDVGFEIFGSGEFQGNLLNAGAIAPGFSTGQLVVEGDYSQAADGTLTFVDGSLTIEIGGVTPISEYDVLQTTGTATLAGVLHVELLDNLFEPQFGDEFEILTADSGILNEFTSEVLPTLASGLEWNVVYGPSSVVLQVVTYTLPGDYNNDGSVDAADYVVWRNNLGSSGELPGDETPDGVTVEDYTVWKNNFGATAAGAVIGGGEVPEPSAVWVAILGVATLVRGVGKRQRRCLLGS